MCNGFATLLASSAAALLVYAAPAPAQPEPGAQARLPATQARLPDAPARLPDAPARLPAMRVLVQSSALAGFRYHAAAELWPALGVGDPLELEREPSNA